MKWSRVSRRHFLTGASAILALPTLTSIAPKSALADSASQKTFIGIGLRSGLYRMYGPTSELMPKTPEANSSLVGYQTLQGPHAIHYHDSLTALASDNGGRISEIIDPSFTPMLRKMLMLQGLDFIGIGEYHHIGHFGNWHQTAQMTEGNPDMASIDVVLSDFFRSKGLASDIVSYGATYGDKDNALSFRADGTRTTSYFFNPATVWDKYFGTTAIPADFKTLIVDKVLDDYRSLRSNPRLGAEDRRRVEAHIEHLAVTETKVKRLSAVCQQLRPSESFADYQLLFRTMNDVIVGLISCGMCNIFVHGGGALVAVDGDEAHKWSHEGYSGDTDAIANATSYGRHLEQNRASMKIIALDLAQKLEDLGQLDNSLIVCVQEHSKRGHQSWNIPVITFGSAGGVFKTDRYVDYRNIAARDDLAFTRFGYPMNQLYANILRAMGMQPSDFEALNKTRSGPSPFKRNSGYGIPVVNPEMASSMGAHYGAAWTNHDMSGWLPRVVA
jgi:hypothetical protein